MIHPERITPLNSLDSKEGRYLLYWMQASPRTEYNDALEYAIERANARRKPLVALFCLTPRFPHANLRHYRFLLEGLQETGRRLLERGVAFVLRISVSPPADVIALAKDAEMVVTDAGYLKVQRGWRDEVRAQVNAPFIQVESNVIVPVRSASGKEEWSAATLRRRIQPFLPRYLVPPDEGEMIRSMPHDDLETEEISSIDTILAKMDIDRSVKPVEGLKGGTTSARQELEAFIGERLEMYAERRNDPTADSLSNMSPYLHFGQISPVYIAGRVLESGKKGAEAYLEELIVRRELAVNFVYYNARYDEFDCLPEWAKKTLLQHAMDRRPYIYALDELDAGETHDELWNAAQLEMVRHGKMHGYMRMYWGKKILEWTRSPQEAYRYAIHLNDRYELDGRDPNGYAGIAWCFGKHDRPWREREIFGTVRYMSEGGMRRKLPVEAYIESIHRM
ncbi:MAG: deoxyribodipyrimidine photo-lyase [Methanomicrobiales archaeon]|nr:deoxyribodipyrimidine photo-lyase [Methanomicrobiales archaeon]